jgi:hypothetical protein
MNANLWLGIAGIRPAWFRENLLSKSVEVSALAIADACGTYGRFKTQAFQLSHRMRQQGDANAQFPDGRSRLVYPARQPHSMEIQCGRKPCYAATDDCDGHVNQARR